MTAKQTQNKHHVVVIGSGLAGLAATCVLSARGYRVTLVEKNDWYGGKAAIHQSNGYRFDMGPTILTLPSVLKKIFREADRAMDDYLDLVPLDPQWRCFFDSSNGGAAPASDRMGADAEKASGNVLDLVSDVEKMKRHLLDFTGDPKISDGYGKFIKVSEQLHRVSDRFFFYRSIGGLRDTMAVGGAFSASVLKVVRLS